MNITGDITNGVKDLGALATDLDTKLKSLADYYIDLSKYDKDKINSYVGITMAFMFYGPSGKLKTEKTVSRTVKEVEKVIEIGKVNRISKFLRDLNLHSHVTSSLMQEKGWTIDKIKQTISNPYKTGKSVDNLDGKIGDLGEATYTLQRERFSLEYRWYVETWLKNIE